MDIEVMTSIYWLMFWFGGLWLFSFAFLFVEEGLQEYLLRFRYRELREGLDSKRERMQFLFSLVSKRKRYFRIFKTLQIVFTLLCGVSLTVFSFCLMRMLEVSFSLWMILPGMILLLIVLSLQIILTYRIPKMIATRYPVRYLNVGGFCLIIVEFICRPLLRLVEFAPLPVTTVSKEKEIAFDEIDSDLQILALSKDTVKLTPVTEMIAQRSLDLSDLSVYDILLPRNQVQIFDVNDGLEANLEKARKTGHTRFPLCRDDLDHCMGIVHIKDIFRANLSIEQLDLEKIARPILKVDQDEPLDRVLQVLRNKRIHMALVEDEFGGIIGVLTMERILEELVGEIQDEFDKEEKMIVEVKKDLYRISGLAPVHEVEAQLKLEDLGNDDVSSFGGLVSHQLGRIPEKGESVNVGPLRVSILETDERRIILTNVKKISTPEQDVESC